MDDQVSKSQKKREADYLQKIGVKLIDFSVAKLDTLPLTDPLRKAILDAKSIKTHGAKRRQAQLIGKLMRASDYEVILEAYERLIEEDNAETVHFHEVEDWRSKLIHEGKEALTAFIDTYQPEDVQHLRQLVKKAIDEQAKAQHTGASKTLFRYLRSLIQ